MPNPLRTVLSLSRATLSNTPQASLPARTFTSTTRLALSEDSLPRVAQPSLWQSMIPKPFRRSADGTRPISAVKTSGWNPATSYIVLALLVGSQAIQLLNIRRYTANMARETEAKLALLKEVIERVKKGEDVDVEGMLGTGDKEREREWEKFMEDIEREDSMFSEDRSRKARRKARLAEREAGENMTLEKEEAKSATPAGDRPPQFV